jgi:hypothetical protein
VMETVACPRRSETTLGWMLARRAKAACMWPRSWSSDALFIDRPQRAWAVPNTATTWGRGRHDRASCVESQQGGTSACACEARQLARVEHSAALEQLLAEEDAELAGHHFLPAQRHRRFSAAPRSPSESARPPTSCRHPLHEKGDASASSPGTQPRGLGSPAREPVEGAPR